jgi:two-component system, cell cycle sensor histidine kinase and response regulator CckA
MQLARQALDALQEGIAIFDPEDRLVECNNQILTIFANVAELWVPGVSFETLLRASYERGEKELARDIAEERIQRRLQKHREGSGELEHHLPDGRRLRIRPHRTDDGHTIITYVDITELSQREEDLRLILEGVGDGVVTIDESGRIETLNPAIAQIFGCRRRDMIGHPLSEFVPNADIWRWIDDHAAAGRSGQQLVREIAGARKDGDALTLLLSLNEIKRRGHRFAVGIVRDVGTRKHAEQALRDSEERFRRLADAAPQGIAIHNRGVFIETNNRLGTLLGYNATEILGTHLTNYLTEEVNPQEIERMLASEEGTVEWRMRRKKGSTFLAELTWRSMPYKGGVASVVSVLDITERREIDERISQAEKMTAIGQLAGGVAHDFNNLLMVIDGYTQRALTNADKPEQVIEALGEVKKAAGKAASLTRQLLAFGRKNPNARQVVSVHRALADVQSLMKPLLGARYEVEVSMPDEDVRVEAAAGQLEQAMINLLINGRDAMPSGGKLRVTVATCEINDAVARGHPGAQAGTYVVFAVEDGGSGIDPETKKRIFEPFFTTKEAGRGTGLGLPMVYGMARGSNGFVDVKSYPGNGTVFFIYLPLVDSPVTAALQNADASMHSKGETVLVVEDNDALLQLVQQALTEVGYNVLTATNGLEAIEVDEEYEEKIDLLLSDVVMPVLGGVEAAISLKTHRPDLPILMMTGYPSHGQAKTVEIPEHFRVLEKPFEITELLKVMREVIDGSAVASDA